MKEIIFDFERYSENFLHIKTKSAELIPFKFNYYQKKIMKMIRKDIKNDVPIRYIILKCRQVGGSTFGSGFNYHCAATQYYKNSQVVAHDNDSTTNLFNMCKLFWESSLENIRPMRRYSNQKKLVFENPKDDERDTNPGLRSTISIDTANNLTAGRSGTIHHLHISELPFWKNAAIVITGLLQAVPYEPNTSVIIEGTANGMGGDGEEFYNRCMSAMKGESDFKFIFFKWTDNPEYEINPPADFRLTEDELILQKFHPELDRRKLAWRRYKINNEMGSSFLDPRDQFKQEYPLTPEEAFLASGRPVFDSDTIISRITAIRDIPFHRGFLTVHGELVIDSKGPLKIFEQESDKKHYALGADVAEGLIEGDFSTMSVLDKNMYQVASFKDHVAPDLFGNRIFDMCEKYRDALCAVEVNNHGHSVMNTLKQKNYTNFYTREVLDQRTNTYTKKIGWQTNMKTKPQMLDAFIANFRDGHVVINDVELLQEMLTLQYEPDGKVNLNGKDLVVSMCIAIQATHQIPEQSIGVTHRRVVDPAKMNIGDKLKWLKKDKRKLRERSFR